MYKNGLVSHWMAQQDAGRSDEMNRGLPEEKQDLVIAGAGLTGLWTAYYAKKRFPDWKVTVVEAEHVGYGASGRNGGWMSTLIPGNGRVYARRVSSKGGDGDAAVREFQRAMVETIEECLRVMREENIHADEKQGGHLLVATSPAGLARANRSYHNALLSGYESDQVFPLSAADVKAEINIKSAFGGVKFHNTVSLDPGKVVSGLANVVRNLGVDIYEATRVLSLKKGLVETDRGNLQTDYALSTLESYTPTVTGDSPGLEERTVVPVNSSMIITNQLNEDVWSSIGWNSGQCLMDAAHTFIYAQRTVDGRIAIGGRGNPYKFASETSGAGYVESQTVDRLGKKLRRLFPDLNFHVEHTWRGTIGVTRDWCAGIFYSSATGVGAVRGYAGHGVTATNLAARTLLDRISSVDSKLTRLPWNDHKSGKWEREPLRWLGIHGMYRLFGIADSYEEKRGIRDTSLLARAAGRIAGIDT